MNCDINLGSYPPALPHVCVIKKTPKDIQLSTTLISEWLITYKLLIQKHWHKKLLWGIKITKYLPTSRFLCVFVMYKMSSFISAWHHSTFSCGCNKHSDNSPYLFCFSPLKLAEWKMKEYSSWRTTSLLQWVNWFRLLQLVLVEMCRFLLGDLKYARSVAGCGFTHRQTSSFSAAVNPAGCVTSRLQSLMGKCSR